MSFCLCPSGCSQLHPGWHGGLSRNLHNYPLANGTPKCKSGDAPVSQTPLSKITDILALKQESMIIRYCRDVLQVSTVFLVGVASPLQCSNTGLKRKTRSVKLLCSPPAISVRSASLLPEFWWDCEARDCETVKSAPKQRCPRHLCFGALRFLANQSAKSSKAEALLTARLTSDHPTLLL